MIKTKLSNLRSCKDCGTVFDKSLVETDIDHEGKHLYICPCCDIQCYEVGY